jgi:outer membrane protein TolC
LLLRKDRAKLTLTKIKLLEADYFLQQTQREVNAFIKSGINEVTTNLSQIAIQNNVVSNSVKLRNAEKINFDNGESSMFLINSRENSLLNNRIKLFEIISKFQKAKANLYNSIGNLGSLYGINTN